MQGTVTGKGLDLSKLTYDEAAHVWQVVQRDFDLRKKEEDRLGELKTKIEQEDCKREMLADWANLTQSHCIRCLKAFKFLVNKKRQCLDCHLAICGSCSHYNDKEHGWVCAPCHMARVLKIGSLEWYHKNMRMRFKRFGSAKVMRSLFKTLRGKHAYSSDDDDDDDDDDDAKHHKYDTQSNPEVHTLGCEDSMDSQHYNQMKKNRRRLTVDPIDFGLRCDYFAESRPYSHQIAAPDDIVLMNLGRRESDVASDFQPFLKAQHKVPSLTPQQDDVVYSDNPTVQSCCMSGLSYSSCGSGSAGGPRGGGSSYFLGPDVDDDDDDDDDSEEDDDLRRAFPAFRAHLGPCDHVSQESLNYPNQPPQITDLNRRMSAIENLLSRLQITLTSSQEMETPGGRESASPLSGWEGVDVEEYQLRRKLIAMAGDISDHSLSSDEAESNRSLSSQEISAAATTTRVLCRSAPGRSALVPRLNELTNSQKKDRSIESLQDKWQGEGSKSSFQGSTALLFELEDKIAQAAADVQNAQTQVSYIENRIAALNSGGMPMEQKRKETFMKRDSQGEGEA